MVEGALPLDKPHQNGTPATTGVTVSLCAAACLIAYMPNRIPAVESMTLKAPMRPSRRADLTEHDWVQEEEQQGDGG